MIKFLFIVLVCFLGVFIGFWWGCNDWSFWLIVSVSCCKLLLDYRFDDPLPYFTSDLQEHIESSVSSAATICLYFWFRFRQLNVWVLVFAQCFSLPQCRSSQQTVVFPLVASKPFQIYWYCFCLLLVLCHKTYFCYAS